MEPAITLVKFFLIQTVFALAHEDDASTKYKINKVACCLVVGKKKGKHFCVNFPTAQCRVFEFDGYFALKLML